MLQIEAPDEKSKVQQFRICCARTKYLSKSQTIPVIARAQKYFLSNSSWTQSGLVEKLGTVVQVTFEASL